MQGHETRPIPLHSRETLVIALAGGSDLHVRSRTHDTRIFCPAAKIVEIQLDARAGSAAAAAGWDDEIWFTSDATALWAQIFEEPRPPTTEIGCRQSSAEDREPEEWPTRNESDNVGGPQWTGLVHLVDWVKGRIDNIGEIMSADQFGSLETEGKIAHTILLSFTPRPPSLLVTSMTEWLSLHITTLASGRNPPRHWQWSWLSFLRVLERCGIHEVARSDPGMYFDLTGQLEAPAWARNAVPFTQWKRGLPAMPLGRAYAGMNRVSGDPRSPIGQPCSAPCGRSFSELGNLLREHPSTQ